MPRDVRGRPIPPPEKDKKHDKDAEPVKAGASADPISAPKEAKEAIGGPAETLREHHDRLKTIEDHLGIKRKADGYKAEDQGGKAKINAGHVTDKGGKQPQPPRRHH